MSFLETLDVLNERLVLTARTPVAFDHDCREGICGSSGIVIDGIADGPEAAITTCQLYMRSFADGDVIDVEPWRAGPFPVTKDLVVDRAAFARIIAAGGFISAPTGSAPTRAPCSSPRSRPSTRSRGGLHRLRCVCGRVPERFDDAVRRG